MQMQVQPLPAPQVRREIKVRKNQQQLKVLERHAWIALALVTVFGLGVVFLDAYLRR